MSHVTTPHRYQVPGLQSFPAEMHVPSTAQVHVLPCASRPLCSLDWLFSPGTITWQHRYVGGFTEAHYWTFIRSSNKQPDKSEVLHSVETQGPYRNRIKKFQGFLGCFSREKQGFQGQLKASLFKTHYCASIWRQMSNPSVLLWVPTPTLCELIRRRTRFENPKILGFSWFFTKPERCRVLRVPSNFQGISCSSGGVRTLKL